MNGRSWCGMNIHYFSLPSIPSTGSQLLVNEDNVACKFDIKLKTRPRTITAAARDTCLDTGLPAENFED